MNRHTFGKAVCEEPYAVQRCRDFGFQNGRGLHGDRRAELLRPRRSAAPGSQVVLQNAQVPQKQ